MRSHLLKRHDCAIFALFLIFSSTVSIAAAQAIPLSLGDYLNQVESQNQTIASSKQASSGAELQSKEASLLYSPTLSVQAQWLDDHFRNALLPTAYEKLQTDDYTIGITQKTPWGLDLGFSYHLDKTGYINALDFVTNQSTDRKFYEGTPKFEISLSLLRNRFGTETKAQEELSRSSALANQYNQRYQVKTTRAQAENAYIRLVSAQQLVAVYTDSLAQAEDLLKYNTRQVRLNLADRSDLLQAQANEQAQKLSLQSSKDELRSAEREFNYLRNVDSDTVTETLTLPSVDHIAIPERAKLRDDVRAAQETAKASAAQARMGSERNKPDLQVFGSYALNAREDYFSRTFDHSWQTGQQTTSVGVRLNVPLEFGRSSDVAQGYRLQSDAAETMAAQRLFDQENEWNDLTQQLSEAKHRYEIAATLAKIQKSKAENERLRLKRGRTTTYQTLTFTQDYNMAEAARIQAQRNVLNVLTRMKTFGDQP